MVEAHLAMFLHVSFLNKHILTSLNLKLKLNEYFQNYDFSHELERMSPQNYKTRCACIDFQKLVKWYERQFFLLHVLSLENLII
jgi:hypothetical protein